MNSDTNCVFSSQCNTPSIVSSYSGCNGLDTERTVRRTSHQVATPCYPPTDVMEIKQRHLLITACPYRRKRHYISQTARPLPLPYLLPSGPMKSLHKKVGAGFATFLFFARLICRCPLRGVEGLVQRWLLRSLLRPANNFPSLSSTPPVQNREKPIPFSPSSTQRRQKGSAKGEREGNKKNQNLQHLFSLFSSHSILNWILSRKEFNFNNAFPLCY